AVLKKLGLDYETPETGCCGMAGAFGFEAAHYDVSIACGERALLPAVRAAPKETLILADGFSCREQIAPTTDRRALHLAQVLQMALHEDKGGQGQADPYPERAHLQAPPGSQVKRRGSLLMGAGALAALGLVTWHLLARRRA